jgi:hypothetical protein
MCRELGMAAEKDRSRNAGDSKLFRKSSKERNHKPSEEKTMIDQDVEFISCSV